MAGWIKDYRKELDSNIWLMPPLYHRVWQWLKYKANHRDNEIPQKDGTSFLIKSGQHLTSYRNIAKGIGWFEGRQWIEPNPKTIKSIITWMEAQAMITVDHGKGNREYTLITLNNWDSYQSDEETGNAKVTPEKQRGNTEVTPEKQLADINKNDKECIKNDKKIYIAVIDYLNEKAGASYQPTTKKTQSLIRARLNEKFTLEDFKTVIDIKTDEWLNTDMEKYLRPETLFGTKFESYLNQKSKDSKPKEHQPDYFKKLEYHYED